MFARSLCIFHSLLTVPVLFPFLVLINSGASDNQPPVAVDDAFQVHGFTRFGEQDLLANDSDPDGDAIYFDRVFDYPQHGNLYIPYGNAPQGYTPNAGYTGPDSFSYRLRDAHGAYSNVATVTLDVRNSAPTPGADSFTVHGFTSFGTPNTLLVNDSDPDGDAISFDRVLTYPQHGNLSIPFGNIPQGYTPFTSYTGPDSFTYRICDNLGLCAGTTVTLDVRNNAPTAGADKFTIRGFTRFTSDDLLANDSDSDGSDTISFDRILNYPSHGNLYIPYGNAPQGYTPTQGFAGTDSFTYRICDNLGLCSAATVTLWVVGDGEDDGDSCPAVGEPINPANGNMYLHQADYQLPSVGFGLNVTRTYNSDSQRVGLFGRGWSTAYDESIAAYDNNLVRLNHGGGRAIYLGRPIGSSGAFTDLIGDLHQQVTQGSGFTLTMKDGSAEQFNSAGKLLSLVDRNGNTTSLTYGANGFLASVTDPFGRVLTVNTNANGQVTSLSDSLGTIATYTYGGSRELLSVTYADNSAFSFSYDGSLRLTTVTDALGNIVESHSYDAQGRAVTSEKQGGINHYSLNYTSDTETDVTDGLGRVTKYTFDKSKGRSIVTRLEGDCSCGSGGTQIQMWTYDNQLNVTSKTDALGHVMSYTYDSNGNRLTETNPTGTVTNTYNEFAEVLTRTDQLNNVTTNTYDGQGNLLTTTDALCNTTTFTYNTRGQLLTSTDARGKITTFSYDTNGNLSQREDANHNVTSFSYDDRGWLAEVHDALNHVTQYAYDAAGRVNKITHPDLSFISFTYDLAGRRTVVTDERNNSTNYAYDGAYRLTSVTDALNHATTYGYDSMSNLTSVTDALSRTTNYEYDDFNRLVKITYPPATVGATRLFETLAYDAGGNVTSRTDTAGHVTSYAYDNINRIISTNDAANETTSFQYDALSRVTSVTDAITQQYQFGYDALGRQTSITRGETSMSYVYDAVGNRSQRTDYNGVVTNYAYDDLNRLTTITYPDTSTVSYGYDELSRLATATNGNGTVTMSYDNRGRAASMTGPFGQTVSYGYDVDGNRTSLAIGGSTYATYVYDAVNRLSSITGSASEMVNYSYDVTNKVTSRTLPNGIITSYDYDGLNRLTRLRHTTASATLTDNQYAYDTANRITQLCDLGGAHTYGYDSVDRLTSATYPGATTESYTYDSVGNRTASHLSTSYTYQGFNKVTSAGGATYAYDNNGNLVTRVSGADTTQYAWDFENRLTQVTLPNGTVVNYKYDALGRRIQRTTSAAADERYVYDGQNVIQDLDSGSSVVTSYLNGAGLDNHLRQNNSTTGVSYFLTDHLGSTVGLTDSSANLVEQVNYDSFGTHTGSSRTRYTYTGRESDPETDLMYYRARFYDAQLGRFISEDPIAFQGGGNWYAYVDNNPLGWIDPEGLCQGQVNPRNTGECARLIARMLGPLGEMQRLWKNYDPVRDYLGGYPIRKTLPDGRILDLGKTKPGGHYRGLKDAQRALRNYVEEFKRKCLNRNDNTNPGLPLEAEKFAYLDIPEPHANTGNLLDAIRDWWHNLPPFPKPQPWPGPFPPPLPPPWPIPIP